MPPPPPPLPPPRGSRRLRPSLSIPTKAIAARFAGAQACKEGGQAEADQAGCERGHQGDPQEGQGVSSWMVPAGCRSREPAAQQPLTWRWFLPTTASVSGTASGVVSCACILSHSRPRRLPRAPHSAACASSPATFRPSTSSPRCPSCARTTMCPTSTCPPRCVAASRADHLQLPSVQSSNWHLRSCETQPSFIARPPASLACVCGCRPALSRPAPCRRSWVLRG